MKIYLQALLLSLLIPLSGCDMEFAIGPGHSDFHAHLAGDYSLYRTSGLAASITPQGYTKETPIIPRHVVECGTDGRFIIAKRQLLKRRSPDNPNDTYMIADPGKFDYWILDTSSPEVFGPLTIEDYDEKKNELSISKIAILRDIYDFRPKDENQNQSQ